jgi:transcription elongation factor Elf1
MRYRDTVHSSKVTGVYTEATEGIVAPKACPFCNSVDVATTSKTVNVSTYWRCSACGEIWNAGRVQHGRRTPSRRFA